MSNLTRLLRDPRSYHGTQSLTRTTMGMPAEGGYLGPGTQAVATPMLLLPITVDFDNPQTLQITLPPGVMAVEWLVTEGAGGTGGTIEVLQTDETGGTVQVIIAPTPVDAPSAAWMPLDRPISVKTAAADDRQGLQVQVDAQGTATGLASFAIQMIPVITAWK